MKFFLSAVISLIIHLLLFIKFTTTEPKSDFEDIYSFNINIVQEIAKLEKNIKSKPSFVKSSESIKSKKAIKSEAKGKLTGDKYLASIRQKIISVFGKNKKLKLMNAKGESKVYLKIQRDGTYEILKLDSKNRFIYSETEKVFRQITQFEAFPIHYDKSVIEPVFTFIFNFN